MKVAIIFPGYGSQYSNMGKLLYDEFPLVRTYFQEASDHLNINFKDLCFLSSNAEINQIDKAYLSVYLLTCSIFELLKQQGIKASYLAGYDTGQYAALYASGGITFLDGLDIIKKYSDLYIAILKQQNYDILKVNGLTLTKLSDYLDKSISIASYQTRTQHLISGTKDGIKNLRETLRKNSDVTMYDEGVGLGLNSAAMNPMVEKFTEYLKTKLIKKLMIPIINNSDGSLILDSDQMKQEIIYLINNPIHWDKVIDTLLEADLIMGVGAQRIFLDLIIEKDSNKKILLVNDAKDLEKVKQMLNNK